MVNLMTVMQQGSPHHSCRTWAQLRPLEMLLSLPAFHMIKIGNEEWGRGKETEREGRNVCGDGWKTGYID